MQREDLSRCVIAQNCAGATARVEPLYTCTQRLSFNVFNFVNHFFYLESVNKVHNNPRTMVQWYATVLCSWFTAFV